MQRQPMSLLAVVMLTGYASSPPPVAVEPPPCPPPPASLVVQGPLPPATARRPQGVPSEPDIRPAKPPLGTAERQALSRGPLSKVYIEPTDPYRVFAERRIDALELSLAGATEADLPPGDAFSLSRLANAWLTDAIDRDGDAEDPDLRRAARLGRLLAMTQADVWQQHGLEVLSHVARRDPAARELAELGEEDPARLADQLQKEARLIQDVRGTSIGIYCRLAIRLEPWLDRLQQPKPELTQQEHEWIRETARCGPWRAMRADALFLLYALSELGDPGERREARELLESYREDEDGIIAATAIWYMIEKPELTPCVDLFGG